MPGINQQSSLSRCISMKSKQEKGEGRRENCFPKNKNSPFSFLLSPVFSQGKIAPWL